MMVTDLYPSGYQSNNISSCLAGFRLSDPVDLVVHRLRRHDTQDPGGLQRVKVHRIHNVHDVRHLAGFCAHLLQVR